MRFFESFPSSNAPKRSRAWVALFLIILTVYYKRETSNSPWRRVASPIRLKLSELLLNYDQFRATYLSEHYLRQVGPLEESSRRLWFSVDQLEVAWNNLATLGGGQLYLMRQSLHKSDLSLEEQSKLWLDMDRVHLLSSSSSSSSSSWSRPVSGSKPGHSRAELEKSSPLSKWFSRLVRKEAHFEIPSYPLDEQPDPSRVTHIDADLRACSGEIRDQKDCGACYVFSFNALAEWHYCGQTGDTSVDFSEQFAVDCGSKAKLRGCTEGLLPDVRDFTHWLGLIPEADYPYKGKKGKCQREEGSINVDVAEFTRIQVNREEWEQMLHEQPILVEALLPRDILSYSRGVHPGLNCDARIGHGMLLVGHGRQDGVAYWLLKNSMGAKWGERGYLRLSRDAPLKQCFANGFVGKFKFKQLAEDKFDDFYETMHIEPSVEPNRKLADEQSKRPNPVAEFLKSSRQ